RLVWLHAGARSSSNADMFPVFQPASTMRRVMVSSSYAAMPVLRKCLLADFVPQCHSTKPAVFRTERSHLPPGARGVGGVAQRAVGRIHQVLRMRHVWPHLVHREAKREPRLGVGEP